MSDFNLNRFTAAIKTNGISRPARFEITIGTRPGSSSVSLMCEISQLPGINITTKQFRIQGPAYQMPVGMEFNGEGIPMTFYVDKNLEIKKYFETWLYSIVNPNSFNVRYQKEYVCPITIYQLDETDKRKYAVSLIDAFPRAISQMDLNAAAANQMHRLTVMFAYRKWEVITPYKTKDDYQDNIKSPYQFQPLSKT